MDSTCSVQKRTDEHIFWLWLFYHSPVHQLPIFCTNIHFCALGLELLMLKANFEPYYCWKYWNCWIYTDLFFGIFDNKPCNKNLSKTQVSCETLHWLPLFRNLDLKLSKWYFTSRMSNLKRIQFCNIAHILIDNVCGIHLNVVIFRTYHYGQTPKI